MEQNTTGLIPSALSDRANFWLKSMKLLNKRYPSQRAMEKATIDDLIDVCYEVHKTSV